MRSKGDGLVATVSWLIGGFVLSVAALFAIFGGFALGLLMLATTPFVIGFLMLNAVFGKRPVYAESAEVEQVGTETALLATAMTVATRVVAVEGTCPQGHTFKVGDVWPINGKAEEGKDLCPSAALVLSGAVMRLKEGLPGSEEVRCVGTGHRVIFAIDGRMGRTVPFSRQEFAPDTAIGRYGNAA